MAHNGHKTFIPSSYPLSQLFSLLLHIAMALHSVGIGAVARAISCNFNASSSAVPCHRRQSLSLAFSASDSAHPLQVCRAVPARAVSSQLDSPPTPGKESEVKKYYFLVANAKFMLDDEEHFQELMCERLRNFGERSREQDFWLVIEPKFLDKYPNIVKRLKRPAVALVSTDANWIT